jgi:hypothetical protein
MFLLIANVIGKRADYTFGIKWEKNKERRLKKIFLNLILEKKIQRRKENTND